VNNTQTENSAADGLSDLTAVLGGVLSYSTTGHNRPCGQTIGANGAGDFCLLITGNPQRAEVKAREYLRNLESRGYRITAAIFTPYDAMASYYGNPIAVIDA